jgi:hypothetical protein
VYVLAIHLLTLAANDLQAIDNKRYKQVRCFYLLTQCNPGGFGASGCPANREIRNRGPRGLSSVRDRSKLFVGAAVKPTIGAEIRAASTGKARAERR